MHKQDYKMEFDIGTIKHLGLQMYSTLPPVIGELVSNAWDADAEVVQIEIPTGTIDNHSEITVWDNGAGMTDANVRKAYLIVGRDRRKEDNDAPTPKHGRKVIGRKGIGKFCAFGIAGEIEVETIQGGDTSRFKMNYSELEKAAKDREFTMPPLRPSGTLKRGTRLTLRHITKFKNRHVPIDNLRRGLARRFSIIGPQNKFEIKINGDPITPAERDLKRLLDTDADGQRYLWEFDEVEIRPGTGWKVSGWIGALDRTTELEDGIQRGIVIMARGKLVQEPFIFDAVVGQQYALSYLIGELYAEFVDGQEDTIGTTRNSLVWDTEANAALKEWGQKEINKIARTWAEKRREDNEKKLAKNPVYRRFVEAADRFENEKIKKVADRLVRGVIASNPVADEKDQEPIIQMCLDYMEFDEFQDLAQQLADSGLQDIPKIVELFREWEVVEAKEMMRVTDGRIKTIEKLQSLVEQNALEVPTLHKFLKEFPWVLDPRWQLIADEKRYSQLLRDEFPDPQSLPEDERRIDFLCVKESSALVVVEIKRPKSKASMKELDQIEDYVGFMREHVQKTSDPQLAFKECHGYLLCGNLVDTRQVRQKRQNLEKAGIFIRRYEDLLRMVEDMHKDFLSRYAKLRKAKAKK